MIARRIITALFSAALAAGLVLAGATPADASSKLNREVASAKKTAMKELKGSDEVRSKWLYSGGKKYGKLYAGLTHYTDEKGEHTLIQPTFVPTYRLDEPRKKCESKKKRARKVIITFRVDGEPTERYSAWRKTAAYAPPARGLDFGTTAWLSAVIKLPCTPDARTKGSVNGNQLS